MMDFIRLNRLRERVDKIRAALPMTDELGAVASELIDMLDEAMHEVVTQQPEEKPDPTQQKFEAFYEYRRSAGMAS